MGITLLRNKFSDFESVEGMREVDHSAQGLKQLPSETMDAWCSLMVSFVASDICHVPSSILVFFARQSHYLPVPVLVFWFVILDGPASLDRKMNLGYWQGSKLCP